jgi:hypothetical protein
MAAPNPLQLSPPTCEDRLIWDVERSSFHFPTLAAADELGFLIQAYCVFSVAGHAKLDR